MNEKYKLFLCLSIIWFNTGTIITGFLVSSGCQDRSSDCQTLQQTVKICSDQFSAQNVCPMTCGKCVIQPTTMPTGCQDQLNDCSVLQQRVQICSDKASAINLCRMTCGICNPQINGGWSNWGPYAACSKSCNSGTKTRSRLCNNPSPSGGGSLCSGYYYESTSCNTQPCAGLVNGGWSVWGSYGACSKSCEYGTKTRHRLCNNPSPSGGGSSCPGASSESSPCNTQQCSASVCDSNPCRNGATCDDHGGSLTCHCRPGFSGDKCEQNCSSCHRGTCNNLTHNTLCSCPRGYRGLTCNIDCHEDFGRAHCPPHFIKIAGLRSCYYFSTHTRRTWDNARGYCQSKHCSNLTVIENEDEEQKLSLYIQHNLHNLHVDENNHDINKGAYFWLDGRRMDAVYDWFWSSSGKNISYHKWHPGTPDDIGNLGDCIAYGPAEGFDSQNNSHIYYWNGRACNVQLYHICEYIPDRF